VSKSLRVFVIGPDTYLNTRAQSLSVCDSYLFGTFKDELNHVTYSIDMDEKCDFKTFLRLSRHFYHYQAMSLYIFVLMSNLQRLFASFPGSPTASEGSGHRQ
jgi:hypothetical protein